MLTPIAAIDSHRGGKDMTATQTALPSKSAWKKFGLRWNQLLENGGVVVDDKISMTIDAQLVAQAE
jgi:hypothetical protein